jgi:hypothetical protein
MTSLVYRGSILMRSTTARWVWPLLGIIIVLFVLNVRAPRIWRHVALRPVSQLMAEAATFIPPIRWDDLGLEAPPAPLTTIIDLPSLDRDRIASGAEDDVLEAHRLRVGPFSERGG